LNLADWYGLVGHALWICGLAVVLATLSMVHFEVRAGGGRLRDRLGARGPQMAIAVGVILFFAGLLFSADVWWERVVWGACAALAIVWFFRLWGRPGLNRGDGT
jgi:hypothetical protein